MFRFKEEKKKSSLPHSLENTTADISERHRRFQHVAFGELGKMFLAARLVRTKAFKLLR